MNLNEYQQEAMLTAQPTAPGNDSKMVAFLGLAGEAGELLSEYKKHLRDGAAHRLYPHRIKEELGDILWYVGRVGNLYEIDLEEIAKANLDKTKSRWGKESEQLQLIDEPFSFDETFKTSEQLPRVIEARMEERNEDGRLVMRMFMDGTQMGDDITDNSHDTDGYRYHDVFHLSYAMMLGWSPVLRQLLKRKRKSDQVFDEVEDGGRAKAIEEGISAMVFAYAKDLSFLEGVEIIDRELLEMIRKMTSGLEVGRRTAREWELTILEGFKVWRQMVANKGGVVLGDFAMRTFDYGPLTG